MAAIFFVTGLAVPSIGGHVPPHVTMLYFLYPIGLVSLISLHGIPMTRCQDHHNLKIAFLYQIIETLNI